jgi:hypothetical protein
MEMMPTVKIFVAPANGIKISTPLTLSHIYF